MKINDRVLVVGPKGSAQAGKSGVVIGSTTFGDLYPAPPKKSKHPQPDPCAQVVTVELDGEDRPRNFLATDLKGGA